MDSVCVSPVPCPRSRMAEVARHLERHGWAWCSDPRQVAEHIYGTAELERVTMVTPGTNDDIRALCPLGPVESAAIFNWTGQAPGPLLLRRLWSTANVDELRVVRQSHIPRIARAALASVQFPLPLRWTTCPAATPPMHAPRLSPRLVVTPPRPTGSASIFICLDTLLIGARGREWTGYHPSAWQNKDASSQLEDPLDAWWRRRRILRDASVALLAARPAELLVFDQEGVILAADLPHVLELSGAPRSADFFITLHNGALQLRRESPPLRSVAPEAGAWCPRATLLHLISREVRPKKQQDPLPYGMPLSKDDGRFLSLPPAFTATGCAGFAISRDPAICGHFLQYNGGLAGYDFDDLAQLVGAAVQADGWPWTHLSLRRLFVPDTPSTVDCGLSAHGESGDMVAIITVLLTALNPLPHLEEALALAHAAATIVCPDARPITCDQVAVCTEWRRLCWRWVWPASARAPAHCVRFPNGSIPAPPQPTAPPAPTSKKRTRSGKRVREPTLDTAGQGLQGVTTTSAEESTRRAQEIMAHHRAEAKRALLAPRFCSAWQPPCSSGRRITGSIGRADRWQQWKARVQAARDLAN